MVRSEIEHENLHANQRRKYDRDIHISGDRFEESYCFFGQSLYEVDNFTKKVFHKDIMR